MNICSDIKVIKERMQNQESFALYFSDGVCSVAESLYPKLEERFTEEYPLIPLESVIVPMSPEILGYFQVFSAPCLLIVIDGKETIRKAGTFGLGELDRELSRLYQLRFD